MYITVEPKFEGRPEEGYVCRADNDDLPFEGRVHATVEDAMGDLDAAYDNASWNGRRISTITYVIDEE